MIIKRMFDVVFSILGMVLLFPVFLPIAILIKSESNGPIFFRQSRVGLRGKIFQIHKLRTMYVNSENIGRITIGNDRRITSFGKFLRRYKIDELPQLINVIINDMSIVGPRPHREQLNIEFQRTVERYMLRHFIKPGITGWAQVNGWRGPTVTFEQKNNRAKHDIWYVENWSLLLDLKIIFLTIFGKKVRKNAF
jgi:putative colanic acid biosynthesis UDP-glucose lipid carrier transferase